MEEWLAAHPHAKNITEAQLRTLYKNALTQLIDDDFVDEEDILDLLDGEVELSSNGDDVFDAKVASLCKNYQQDKERLTTPEKPISLRQNKCMGFGQELKREADLYDDEFLKTKSAHAPKKHGPLVVMFANWW